MRSFRATIERHSVAALLVAGLLMVSSALTLTDSFNGEASATYGPLPVPAVAKKSSSSSKRSVLRKAAPSSAAGKTWTDRECSDRNNDECKQKMLAVLKDDYSCFFDDQCKFAVVYCSLMSSDCDSVQLRKWFFDTFFTDCLEKGDATCIAGTAFMTGNSAPLAVSTCVNSGICREFLAGYRRGDITCRRYQPCLDALASMIKSPSCDTWNWCKNMKKIDEIYTNDWQKCPTLTSADCIGKLGLTPYVTVPRRKDCHSDGYCQDSAEQTASTLTRSYDYAHNPIPACFLWKECKDYFLMTNNWACNAAHVEPTCTRTTNVLNYLTKTNPSCVTSGETGKCQTDLKKMLK